MNRSKGFTLIEILVVVIIAPIIAYTLHIITLNIILEMPRQFKLVEENKTLLNMLSMLRDDVEKATSLPSAWKGQEAGPEVLFISSPAGLLRYQIASDHITRTLFDIDNATDTELESRRWYLPMSNITWNLRLDDSQTSAVEITASVNLKTRRELKKRLENSYIFFAGIYEGKIE